MDFVTTFFNIIVVTLFIFSAYAIRLNYKRMQWLMILTDNIVRWIFALLLASGGAYIIVYVPEFANLIEQTGFITGTLAVGSLGVAIAGVLISILPSDTGIKEKLDK